MGRNHAFDVVIGKAQVVQQRQQYIRGISGAFAGGSLVQLVDDENQIGLSSHGKCFHDDARLRVGINPGASRQLLRVVYGAHIQRGPGEF